MQPENTEARKQLMEKGEERRKLDSWIPRRRGAKLMQALAGTGVSMGMGGCVFRFYVSLLWPVF